MNNMIKVNDGTMSSDVFYGSIRINGNSVSVCNHLKDENEVYKFRMTAKARAGFQVIRDFEGTVKELPMALSKHTTVVEVAKKYPFLHGQIKHIANLIYDKKDEEHKE